MNRKKYIYQQENWPNFIWNIEELSDLLAKVRNKQGRLIGKMETLGFDLQNEAFLETLTTDIIKSNEMEGIVDMMLDATRNFGGKAHLLKPSGQYF